MCLESYVSLYIVRMTCRSRCSLCREGLGICDTAEFGENCRPAVKPSSPCAFLPTLGLFELVRLMGLDGIWFDLEFRAAPRECDRSAGSGDLAT